MLFVILILTQRQLDVAELLRVLLVLVVYLESTLLLRLFVDRVNLALFSRFLPHNLKTRDLDAL